MSPRRKIYTISAGWFEVRNVKIVAASPEKALAKAKRDWDMGRNLNWRDCPSFEPPHFQIEDVEPECSDLLPAKPEVAP